MTYIFINISCNCSKVDVNTKPELNTEIGLHPPELNTEIGLHPPQVQIRYSIVSQPNK